MIEKDKNKMNKEENFRINRHKLREKYSRILGGIEGNEKVRKVCLECWGAGYILDKNLKESKCLKCKGTGWTILKNMITCKPCSGTGKRYHGPDDEAYTPCEVCKGKGYIKTKKK